MATTVVAAAAASSSLCGPLPQRQQAYNLQAMPALSFSNSSLLKSRAVSSRNTGDSPSSSLFGHERGASYRGAGPRGRRSVFRVQCSKATEERTAPTAETSLPVRLAWYASEAFGKVVAGFRPPSQSTDPLSEEEERLRSGPVERKEAVELLRADLDRSYFVTGNMATGIYEEDCEFADPFVSFKGLKRFKQNVGNLGSFMEESSLKLVDWQEYEDRIFAKWRFNCVLALPWRPILAASGSTEYFFSSDSGRIYKHIETWDISPIDGLRQLVKPNPKKKAQKNSS